MAWFPAHVTYPSILGEMFSAAFTSANFNWICSPAVTELETVMMDWVAQLLHLPEVFFSHGSGGGCIQGTASEAVATCIVAARERYLERASAHLPEGSEEKEDLVAELRSKLVALGSEQAHSCTAKGARIAGVRYRSIKTQFHNELAMTGEDVRIAVEELKAKGLHPFYLTTSFGTTGTCAVDCFTEIAAVLKSHPDIWIHVDAAYAGMALCLPEVAEKWAAQMALADSFETNLHKWGLVNLDAGCLFVRQRRDLTDAFNITPSYLRSELSDRGLVTDYRDWGIPLGRRFRALKVWFVMRTYGVQGFRSLIRKHIDMGERFAELVRTRKDLLEIAAKPAFALTVVRCIPPRSNEAGHAQDHAGKTEVAETDGIADGVASGAKPAAQGTDQDLQEANELTKEVYELINKRGDFFLTSGVINGVYAIRVVSANPKAEMKYLEQLFEVLVETTKEVIAERSGSKS